MSTKCIFIIGFLNEVYMHYIIEYNKIQYIISGHENGTLNVWEFGKSFTEKGVKLINSNTASEVSKIRVLAKIMYIDEEIFVSGSKDSSIKGWRFTDLKKELFTLNGHTEDVFSLASINFNGESLLISGGFDFIINIWSLLNLTIPNFIFKTHTDTVSALLTYQNNLNETLFASGGWDDSIMIWNLEGNEPSKPLFTLNKHSDSVSSLAIVFYNKSKYLASGSWDQTAKIWDLNSYLPLFSFRGHTDSIYSIAQLNIEEEQLLVTGGFDNNLYLWSFTNPSQPKAKILGSKSQINAIIVVKIKHEKVIISGTKTQILFY